MNQVSSPPPSAALPFEKKPPDRKPKDITPKWRQLLAVMFNPAGLIQERASTVSWPKTLLIPALAFSLFFMQTGLDQNLDGTKTLFLTFLGLLYGTVGVIFISLIAWVGSRMFGGKIKATSAIRSFALAYSPTLVYVVLGFFASTFLGWRTAIAFGVTGVLWALGPMITSLRQMTGGKTVASITLATICGTLLLFGWSILGGI